MTQHKDQMRAEFEAWARSFGTWDVQRDDEPNFRVESYTEMEVSIAWHAWQAARASAQQGVPEAVIRETCKNYQGTAWGMIAECICDEIILVAAPQPVAQKGQHG